MVGARLSGLSRKLWSKWTGCAALNRESLPAGAYINGVVDLAEAEGLSDLLAAETELQRRLAIRAAGGALSQKTEEWQEEILRLSAMVEAELDFSDEDDVAEAQTEGIKSGAARVIPEKCVNCWTVRAAKNFATA